MRRQKASTQKPNKKNARRWVEVERAWIDRASKEREEWLNRPRLHTRMFEDVFK